VEPIASGGGTRALTWHGPSHGRQAKWPAHAAQSVDNHPLDAEAARCEA
jgi:hypothetical protein